VKRATVALVVLLQAAPLPLAAAVTTPDARVTLDAAALGRIAHVRSGRPSLIALVPFARADGWHADRRQHSVLLTGEDRTILLTVGSRAVREDGELRGNLSEPLVLRGSELELAVPDVERIFAVTASGTGETVAFAHRRRLDTNATIVDVPRPATPRPRATPRAAVPYDLAMAAQNGSAGRVVLSLDQTGPFRLLTVQAETHGAYIQSSFDATGIDGFGTPSATVQAGTDRRGITLGIMPDPLSGVVIGGGVFDGVDLHDRDIRREVFAGRRLDDGISSVGFTIGDPLRPGGADTLAVLLRGDSYAQTLLRHESTQRYRWGDITEDTIAGTDGVGAGIAARTVGRTFVESRVAFATGLPQGPNDEPVSIDVGRHLSDATTVVAGFAGGNGFAYTPFVGLSTSHDELSGALGFSDRALTASLALQDQRGVFQAYASEGASRSIGASGTLFMPHSVVDLYADETVGGFREASISSRTTHTGINLITGVALEGNRVGPIAGISVPVSPLFAVEATVRAAATGFATRFSLAINIPRAKPRGPRTVPLIVRIDGDVTASPVRLFVDGAPLRHADGNVTSIDVTPGAHQVSAETLDQHFGSPPQQIDIPVTGGTQISLALWPERIITGHVRVTDPHAVSGDISLSGIVIGVEPGDATAVTGADGTFYFGKQPFAPGAVLKVDVATLPEGLSAPYTVLIADSDLEMPLGSALKIDEQHFGSSGTSPRKKSKTKR
jgi:hypothetical protein